MLNYATLLAHVVNHEWTSWLFLLQFPVLVNGFLRSGQCLTYLIQGDAWVFRHFLSFICSCWPTIYKLLLGQWKSLNLSKLYQVRIVPLITFKYLNISCVKTLVSSCVWNCIFLELCLRNSLPNTLWVTTSSFYMR